MALPSGYTELEYLESSGTQHIDSGLSLSDGFNLEAEFMLTDTTTQYQVLFGCQDASNTLRNYVGFNQTNVKVTLGYGSGSSGYTNFGTTSADMYCHLIVNNIYNKRQAILNGVSYSLTASTNSTYSSKNMYVFAMNYNGTVSNRFRGRLYRLRVINSAGTSVRYFVPAKRNSDSVLGLYDTVNSVFYINQGTGTFIAGPVVDYSAQPNQFKICVGNDSYYNLKMSDGTYTIGYK